MTQILTNLVGNALKFTPANGTITISAKLSNEKSLAGDQMIEVSVQDTGPGIGEEDKKKLFQKFVQGKGAQGGTGLGLVICKELIEMHKGRIWFESEEGKGSKFIFLMPVKIPDPTDKEAAL